MARGLLACRDLVPRPGIEPRPPALGARSLTHWTTKKVPPPLLFFLFGILRNCRVYWVCESLYMYNFQISMINMRCKVYLGNLFLISPFLLLLLTDGFDSCFMRNRSEQAVSHLPSTVSLQPLESGPTVFHLLL